MNQSKPESSSSDSSEESDSSLESGSESLSDSSRSSKEFIGKPNKKMTRRVLCVKDQKTKPLQKNIKVYQKKLLKNKQKNDQSM